MAAFDQSVKYEMQANRIEAEVMKYHQNLEGWTSMKSQRGMSIWYRKSPHFHGNLYKFEYVIEAPDDAVFNVMRPPLKTEERLSWDKSIKHFECFKNISEDMMVGLILTHSMMAGLISSREFLDLYYFRKHLPCNDHEFDRISWILAEDIDLPERPVTSQYVRAHNHPTGYAVCRYKDNPNKSKLILYINVDVGGMLPQSLVESALPRQQASYVESVKKRVFQIIGKN